MSSKKNDKIDNKENLELIVKKSTEMIRDYRHHFFTFDESRMIAYICTLVKDDAIENAGKKEYKLVISDYCKAFGIAKGGSNYEKAKETIKSLANKSFWHKDNTDSDKEHLIQWVQDVNAERGKGIITFYLPRNVAPYVCELGKNFTSYEISNLINFSKESSVLLYELLKSYAFNTEKKDQYYIEEVQVDINGVICTKQKYTLQYDAVDMVFYLGLGDRVNYVTNSALFITRIINPCIKEINESTELYIETSKIKIKKGSHMLVFDIYFDKTDIDDNEE